jgi:hypothetical protein
MSRNAFEVYLTECWRSRLFSPSIFPGTPFRKKGWLGLAFNRDHQGDQRLPRGVWAELLLSIGAQTAESTAFVCAAQDVLGGNTAALEQPFLVKLEIDAVLGHFASADHYHPEFWMAGVSEDWAIWGDSDFTVVGGSPNLMKPVISSFGGDQGALAAMCSDFEVSVTQDCRDEGMRNYLACLVSQF